MTLKKKTARRSGTRKANIQLRRFLAAKAAEHGSLAALARAIARPEQTLSRLMDGEPPRDATADDYLPIVRRLGFVGVTGLERPTLPTPTSDEPASTEGA